MVKFQIVRIMLMLFGRDFYAGGIVGIGADSIIKCASYGNITALCMVGGIAGDTNNLVSECYNFGTIKATSKGPTTDHASYCGGIVGRALGTQGIKNCFNVGDINPAYQEAGGICGQSGGTGVRGPDIEFCINIGNIKTGGYVGDILGWGYGSKVSYCLVKSGRSSIGSGAITEGNNYYTSMSNKEIVEFLGPAFCIDESFENDIGVLLKWMTE